ncbi:hypothetical protein VTI74DRAFT_1988 [Chaetomium olivicolor]
MGDRHLGLGNNCCKFRLFLQHGAGNGLWNRGLRLVTYWVCVVRERGDGRNGGVKKTYRAGKTKRTCHSYRAPLSGRSFLRTDNILNWALSSATGHKGRRGSRKCSISSNRPGRARHTHTVVSDYRRLSNLATIGLNRLSRGYGLGRFGIRWGGAVRRVGLKRGEEACIARECTGVMSGLWCS